MSINLSTLFAKTDTFANSINPDETVIMSRLIRICLVCHSVLDLQLSPYGGSGCVQMQRWKSSFQKLRAERINELSFYIHLNDFFRL